MSMSRKGMGDLFVCITQESEQKEESAAASCTEEGTDPELQNLEKSEDEEESQKEVPLGMIPLSSNDMDLPHVCDPYFDHHCFVNSPDFPSSLL